MAAEKLTKKRLIQLIIAMIILLALFSYRTFKHQAQTNNTWSDTHTSLSQAC